MTQGIGRPLNPWRQGSQVDRQHAIDMGWIQAEEIDGLLIAITHDCDLQSAAESEVELLRATVVSTALPDCTHGKNPRILHLPQALGADGTLEITQSRPLRVPKDALLASNPVKTLSDSDRGQLASWLASRYKRAPFPDSFDQRLRRAKTVDSSKLSDRNISRIKRDRSLAKQLIGVFTSDGGPIEGIYISLKGSESAELDPTHAYSLGMVVVATSRGAAEEETRLAIAASVAEKLRGLFENAVWDSSVGEITLEICAPSTERDFPLYQFRRMLRWHLDWLSGDPEDSEPEVIQPAR